MRGDNLSGTKYPINNFDDDDDVVFLWNQIIMLTVMMWILML